MATGWRASARGAAPSSYTAVAHALAWGILFRMQFRAATEYELGEVSSLLAEAELPPLESGLVLANLILALDDSKVVACVGLEAYGRSGLVRSMVVAPHRRSSGLGRELFRSLLARAYELGLKELFLLTVDAEGFFTKLGFASVSRDETPAQVQDIREYRELLSETATLMRLRLA